LHCTLHQPSACALVHHHHQPPLQGRQCGRAAQCRGRPRPRLGMRALTHSSWKGASPMRSTHAARWMRAALRRCCWRTWLPGCMDASAPAGQAADGLLTEKSKAGRPPALVSKQQAGCCWQGAKLSSLACLSSAPLTCDLQPFLKIAFAATVDSRSEWMKHFQAQERSGKRPCCGPTVVTHGHKKK